MDVYQINLTGLLGLCAALFVAQRKPADQANKTSKDQSGPAKHVDSAEASQWPFLTVFALVMGSDWLQGPFLYSLYREEHGLAAHLVSTLFTTGFLAGAVSAYVTGTLADKHGRKAACLVFCVAYALSCLLTMVPPPQPYHLPLLLAGRVLGGLSTSLLFSVFESWMVTDFHARRLADRGGDLSRTFGVMSTLNSVVAIASGVLGEWIVAVTGTRKAPFAVAVGLLGVAFWVIATRWEENYGDAAAAAATTATATATAKKTTTITNKGDGEDRTKVILEQRPTLWSMLKDPRIVCLGLVSTMFEGSMYLFVFFWGPALHSAHQYEATIHSGGSGSGSGSSVASGLPYGIIFASFMAAVLAASLVFNIIMDRKLVRYTFLLVGLVAVADATFYALEQPRGEQVTFWLFALFEACVGMYWPCMGYLKGQLVEDGVRAQLYGVLRVPLNVFVVVALYLTSSSHGEGEDEAAYTQVFAVCSRLLLLSIGAMYAMIMNEESLP